MRKKEEAYARIAESVENAARLRHDLRQMFTAMQGMNEAGKCGELEAYCKEALAQIQADDGEGAVHEPL
ncbi:MAG TPA: hypothetical protein DEB31_03435 [Clostridiales bacterium]|nr:hypothetical protein [Clostridiales bacterium]